MFIKSNHIKKNMTSDQVNKKHIQIILLFSILQFYAIAAVMDSTSLPMSTKPITTTTTTTSKLPTSTTWTQPTFNFDFSSMSDRSTAQNAMTSARTNWGTFFTDRPKAAFT